MAVDDDDVIDHVAVKVHADTDGVAKEAAAGIKKEQKRIPTAKVRLVADKTGFVASVYEELKKVKAQPQFKIKLVADSSTFLSSVRAALVKEYAKAPQPVYKVKVLAEGIDRKRSGAAAARADSADDSTIDPVKRLAKQQQMRLKGELATEKFYEKERKLKEAAAARDRRDSAEQQRSSEKHAAFERMVGDELNKIHHARAEDEISIRHDTDRRVSDIAREGSRLRIALLGAEEKIEKEQIQRVEKAEKESADRRTRSQNSLKKAFGEAPPIIDWGGKGIKPMNLLYSSVAALTPALFAMSTSALQASTSVAALGAAGIGAGLAISGLALAFGGVSDLMKLSKTVKNEKLVASAKDAVKGADDAARAQRDLASAQRDERAAYAGIHKARQEAIRDLEDLRKAVRDLDNQYKSDRLSVAEAEANERATNANFFATALDRARAHQDTLDARTRLADTQLERRQKRQDLAQSVKKGVEGSDKVIDAREKARDARDRRLDVQAAKTKQNVGAVTSAQEQFNQKMRDASPAARNMVNFLRANEERFKSLRRTIEQGVLPGFTTFLKQIMAAPKGGKSTLQLAAEYAGELGGIIGKYAGDFGKMSRQPWFRKDMATIQKNNTVALTNLATAAQRLIKPVVRIFTTASPLLVTFSEKLIDIADAFDKWITRADRSGALQQWFKDAAKQAKLWWDILVDVGTIIRDLFTAALPSGGDLVTRFRDFIDSIAKWTSSNEGQTRLIEFFDFFRRVDYAQVGRFLTQFAELFLAMRAVKWVYANPFFTAMGILATSNPAGAITLMQGLSKVIDTVGGWVTSNPEVASVLLSLVALGKLSKAGGGILFKLSGMTALTDMLKGKFTVLDKFLGGGATSVMNVRAGVVNVYGGGGLPDAGVPSGTPKPGGKAKNLAVGALHVAGGAFVAAMTVDAILGESGSALDGLIALAKGPDAYNKWSKEHSLFGPPKQKSAGAVEKTAFASLQGDIRRFGFMPGMKTNDPGVVNRKFVKEYIDARKKSVDVLVAETKAKRGDNAAQQVRTVELKKSADVLSGLLQQYGWTKAKADAYSAAVTGLNDALYDNRVNAYLAKGAIDKHGAAAVDAGKKADEATPKIRILNTELDKVGGVKTVTFTTDGKEKVQTDLEGLAAYQSLLRQGKPFTEANIRHEKVNFAKMKADGGLIDGFSPHDRADNIPAMLTAREYVQPVSSVKYYGTDFMEAVRTKRFPRFAAGGQVWPFPVKVPPEAGKVEADPGLGWTPYTGAVPKGLSGLKGLSAQITAAAVDAFAAMGAKVSSGLRPGAITVTGNRSYHGYGRAIDLVPPSMRLFNYMKSRYGARAKELIYSPAGPDQVWHGKPHMYSGAVRATHWNHIHLALAKGGLVQAKKYDSGGTLPPGYSLAFNGTGQPETVRTRQQEQNLQGPLRLDRRDLALLASSITSGGASVVNMDGRKVAELTNRYNYLPAGV